MKQDTDESTRKTAKNVSSYIYTIFYCMVFFTTYVKGREEPGIICYPASEKKRKKRVKKEKRTNEIEEV